MTTLKIDGDEFDFARDSTMEELALIDDIGTRASQAQGFVMAGIIVLSSILTDESMQAFLAHVAQGVEAQRSLATRALS